MYQCQDEKGPSRGASLRFYTTIYQLDTVYRSRYKLSERQLLFLLQALDCLREHYHPSMLNNPDGIVLAKLEFNLAGVKKERYGRYRYDTEKQEYCCWRKYVCVAL